MYVYIHKRACCTGKIQQQHNDDDHNNNNTNNNMHAMLGASSREHRYREYEECWVLRVLNEWASGEFVVERVVEYCDADD